MDISIKEHERYASKANLSKGINDVQKAIDLLTKTREAVVADPQSASSTVTRAQKPLKDCFASVKEDLLEVYRGNGKYQKTLEAKFKDKPFPTSDNNALATQTPLINRAIAMHLLREGQFDVASQFLTDITSATHHPSPPSTTPTHSPSAEESLSSIDPIHSPTLRHSFEQMYSILSSLRQHRDLLPAIAWSRIRSQELENRGSNLEFELAQLQFIHLFDTQGRDAALAYARAEDHHFAHFQSRYLNELSRLASSLAYQPSLASSPYRALFLAQGTWDDLARSFTREFCSLLGLSAQSPLYIAATAGAIALPTLLKLQTIMKDKRAEWTTAQELPVEIPLPPSYQFHSIFVCPVSKEQTTDENPPMMMPCGHVVAQETLCRMARGSRFKCPYCPSESRPVDAVKLFM
ncbi:MAG: hypothetical protein OHK93_001564 [Ramalina farinacea]|uniref:GID complex catalytic subunit 2 n=1 Tax=Ramalina farinacea TaxID=258253 RepID=A0AA43TWC8_9LECA|nr:hypothetical protein [Ramalina farinacea]